MAKSFYRMMGLLVVDLERSSLGLTSRVSHKCAGRTVLLRTLEQLACADSLDGILLVTPRQQYERVAELLRSYQPPANESRPIELVALDEPVSLSPRLSARKWSLASWRGGLREACLFDEQAFTAEIVELLKARDTHSVIVVPPEAVLIDPQLVDSLIAHHRTHGDQLRFSFTQASPGLAPVILRLDMLHELVTAGTTLGQLMAWYPDRSCPDLIMQPCTMPLPLSLCTTGCRLIADTERGFRGLQQWLLDQGLDSTAPILLSRLIAENPQAIPRDYFQRFPREIEIDVTFQPSRRCFDTGSCLQQWLETDTSPDNQAGNPPGQQQQGPLLADTDSPGPPALLGSPTARTSPGTPAGQDALVLMTVDDFRQLILPCRVYDDVCLTLGRLAEPLAHPRLLEIIHAAKEASCFGINLETDGLGLTPELTLQLVHSPLDTITVWLDADSPGTYRVMKGRDGFETVVENMEYYLQLAAEIPHSPQLVPVLTKSRETLDEMEAFYDRWLTRCGVAVIRGLDEIPPALISPRVRPIPVGFQFTERPAWHTVAFLPDGRLTHHHDFTGQDSPGRCDDPGTWEAIWAALTDRYRMGQQSTPPTDSSRLQPV